MTHDGKFLWGALHVEVLTQLVRDCDGGEFVRVLAKDAQKNHIYLKRRV